MRLFTALVIYRLVLPFVFVAAFPGWVVKMLRRGGLTTRLGERVAIYSLPIDHEPCGVVHVHAVSVGESILALKLIRAWQVEEPGRCFVLSTGTATGHAVASAANIPELRVTYSPLDFPSMVRRYLDRFEPSQVVLIEGEAWPHLLLECGRRNIPVRLVNARMSPRSARRFQRFAPWLRPIYRHLDAVAIQEPEDAAVWEALGVAAPKIHHTGSLKFDPGSGHRPTRRAEFQEMLDVIGGNRPVILAASTHPGEDAWMVQAIRKVCPEVLAVLVPRHAERRAEVEAELEAAGHQVFLRSSFPTHSLANPLAETPPVFVIDSTGELADWTAHADAVVIGKSFLSVGGQNPCEAILASKPIVFGPHMENFQPLADRLVASGGAISACNQDELARALTMALDPDLARAMTAHATALIQLHDGATQRILTVLGQGN